LFVCVRQQETAVFAAAAEFFRLARSSVDRALSAPAALMPAAVEQLKKLKQVTLFDSVRSCD
jgi:hypothetical protein